MCRRASGRGTADFVRAGLLTRSSDFFQQYTSKFADSYVVYIHQLQTCSPMPKQLPIIIPQAAIWLLRLAVNPVLSRSLQNDPVAFSAWYATVGGIIGWPDEVVRIQEQERAKRLSLDRMMKLLSQINYVFCGRTNAEHARLVLEGYAVHDWVGRHPREFMALATEVLEKLLDLRSTSALVDETASPF